MIRKAIHFSDYPEFQPNLTPREIFEEGAFGGTYWRPIKSKFFANSLKDRHKLYPISYWKNLPEDILLTNSNYDSKINKYGVKVGTSLQYWEDKDWIRKSHPYGWVEWYTAFYSGERSKDDERQIQRWLKIAGPKGRFRRWLISSIKKNRVSSWNDVKVSPKIRQTLLHWGYELTYMDFKKDE